MLIFIPALIICTQAGSISSDLQWTFTPAANRTFSWAVLSSHHNTLVQEEEGSDDASNNFTIKQRSIDILGSLAPSQSNPDIFQAKSQSHLTHQEQLPFDLSALTNDLPYFLHAFDPKGGDQLAEYVHPSKLISLSIALAESCLSLVDFLPHTNQSQNSTQHTCLGDLPSQSIRLCDKQLRIPLIDRWKHWLDLNKRAAPDQTNDKILLSWSTFNPRDLVHGLFTLESFKHNSDYHSQYFWPDGSRKIYLQYNLNQFVLKNIISKLRSGSSFAICHQLISPNYKPELLGVLLGRRVPKIRSSSKNFLETSMRVFFDPGWRLEKVIHGSNLDPADVLSLKLDGCLGKMEDKAVKIGHPKTLQANNQPSPASLDFEIEVKTSEGIDATSDWRRAAYLLKFADRGKGFSPTATATSAGGRSAATQMIDSAQIAVPVGPKRVAARTNQYSDDTLYVALTRRSPICCSRRLSMCYYSDPGELEGILIGTTSFNLGKITLGIPDILAPASSDAAEFVALSIFILLGLPVSCMWVGACLGYKHKKLRNDLRRLRLVQQRHLIEDRLANYIGLDVPHEESSDTETDPHN